MREKHEGKNKKERGNGKRQEMLEGHRSLEIEKRKGDNLV